MNTSSDHQVISLFMKSGSVNVMAMSKFWSEAVK